MRALIKLDQQLFSKKFDEEYKWDPKMSQFCYNLLYRLEILTLGNVTGVWSLLLTKRGFMYLEYFSLVNTHETWANELYVFLTRIQRATILRQILAGYSFNVVREYIYIPRLILNISKNKAHKFQADESAVKWCDFQYQSGFIDKKT